MNHRFRGEQQVSVSGNQYDRESIWSWMNQVWMKLSHNRGIACTEIPSWYVLYIWCVWTTEVWRNQRSRSRDGDYPTITMRTRCPRCDDQRLPMNKIHGRCIEKTQKNIVLWPGDRHGRQSSYFKFKQEDMSIRESIRDKHRLTRKCTKNQKLSPTGKFQFYDLTILISNKIKGIN